MSDPDFTHTPHIWAPSIPPQIISEFDKILSRLEKGFHKYRKENNGEVPSHILISDKVHMILRVNSCRFRESGLGFSAGKYRNVPMILIHNDTDFIGIGKFYSA